MSRAASLEQGEESSNNHRSRKPSWEKKNIGFPDGQVRKQMRGSCFLRLVLERKKIILKPMLLFPKKVNTAVLEE